jgi:hypothetical protein
VREGSASAVVLGVKNFGREEEGRGRGGFECLGRDFSPPWKRKRMVYDSYRRL